MQLNKSFLLLFVGSNVIAAVIAFIINTWVNISYEVEFIGKYTYNLALASFVFTLIDFGRINDSLLNNNSSRKDLILNIILSIGLCVLALGLKVISMPVFVVTVLLFIQRYILNYNVITESRGGIMLLQICGSLIRLLLVLLISINFETGEAYVLILGLIVLSVVFLKHRVRKLFTKTALNIGALNLGLILIERFDVLALRNLLTSVNFASLSAILSYTYLIGIFIDPIIKLLYKSGNEISIKLLDAKIKDNTIYITAITCLITLLGYFILDYFFGDKFVNILLFLLYGVLLQLIRILAQVYEITILEKSTKKIILLRALSILILFVGMIVLDYVGLIASLIIFLLSRLIPIFAIRRL